MRALYFAAIIATLFSASASTVVAAGSDVPDFKKMKVKEIKNWMKTYDLSCPDCTDKESLVAFCLKNAQAKPKAVRTKVPEGKTLWDAWSDNAKEICTAQVVKSNSGEAGSKVCDTIKIATEAFYMQFGKRTANKLRSKPEALLKTSYGDIYYNAGRRILTRLVKHCLAAKNIKDCQSSSHVQNLMESEKVSGAPFVIYMTNIGVANTNPMYDILKDKKGLDHDEL